MSLGRAKLATQPIAVSYMQRLQLFKLTQQIVSRDGVVAIPLKLCDNRPLLGHVLFPLSNVTFGLGKVFFQNASVHVRESVSAVFSVPRRGRNQRGGHGANTLQQLYTFPHGFPATRDDAPDVLDGPVKLLKVVIHLQ